TTGATASAVARAGATPTSPADRGTRRTGTRQVSRARRSPLKIWRRIGKSQLRNVGRRTVGWVAHEPPRSTLYSGPKNTSEYSRYGWATNPGHATKLDAVHSHTCPTPSSAPDRWAASHSTSVGRRAPAQRAKASASYQDTWHTGTSARRSSCHESGPCARCSVRHAQPSALQTRRSS